MIQQLSLYFDRNAGDAGRKLKRYAQQREKIATRLNDSNEAKK
jgi:hypothetical protein